MIDTWVYVMLYEYGFNHFLKIHYRFRFMRLYVDIYFILLALAFAYFKPMYS
jgi:hypothetical protein